LLVCTFVVVAAHAALIESMAGHGTRRPASGSAEQLPARLILLDREQVASLVLPRAEASAALEPKPAGKAHEAASAQDVDTDQGSSTGSSAGAHTLRPATSIYRPPEQLDVPPRPRSAPDISVLNGLAWSGTPIRLRLFIDGQGQVVDAQVLQSGEADEVIALVRQMFLATGFTAAIANGQPVPSYKDIEITVGTPP
jgi:hypothetical protein